MSRQLDNFQLHTHRQRLLRNLPLELRPIALRALSAAKKSGELYTLGWEKIVANVRFAKSNSMAEQIKKQLAAHNKKVEAEQKQLADSIQL